MATDTLFATPSVISGIAGVLDLSGTVIYNEPDTPEQADANALASDWSTVGQDLREALSNYGAEQTS